MYKSVKDFLDAIKVGTAPKDQIVFLDDSDLVANNLSVFAVHCKTGEEAPDGPRSSAATCVGLYRNPDSKQISMRFFWLHFFTERQPLPMIQLAQVGGGSIRELVIDDLTKDPDRYVSAIAHATLRLAIHGVTGK